MRFSMSIGPGEAGPPPDAIAPLTIPVGLTPEAAAAEELRLLEAQLERMRGMLFGYSSLFFATIRNWTFLSIGLLVLGWSGVLPAAVVPVPFIVPFAFLETGYLFWYTVFARRHAERLEQAINERLGRDVLVAHRLEAAYFYPPDEPKIAALSFGNPLGFMGAMTIGYSAGAGLLWLAGLLSTNAWLEDQGVGLLGGGSGLAGLVVPLAVAWTLVIAGYLVWSFLRRPDEERFLAVLREAYRLPERTAEPPAEPVTPAAEPAPPVDPIDAAPAAEPPPPSSPEDR